MRREEGRKSTGAVLEAAILGQELAKGELSHDDITEWTNLTSNPAVQRVLKLIVLRARDRGRQIANTPLFAEGDYNDFRLKNAIYEQGFMQGLLSAFHLLTEEQYNARGQYDPDYATRR